MLFNSVLLSDPVPPVLPIVLNHGTRGRIEAADAKTLLEWGERLLFAQTPEDVFEKPL